MKAHMMQQTSDEWWSIRRAKPTASNFSKIIRASDGAISKSYPKYIAELLAEAAMPDADYFSTRGVWRGNHAMQHGKETEPQARAWYAMESGESLQQVGFCLADSGTWGCSPDFVIGLVQGELGDTVEAVGELKCPQLETHFEYLLEGTLPIEYKVQCHGHLACCESAKYCAFVSYHLDAPGLVILVERDDYTRRVEDAVEEFVDKLTSEAKRLGVMLKNQERNAA